MLEGKKGGSRGVSFLRLPWEQLKAVNSISLYQHTRTFQESAFVRMKLCKYNAHLLCKTSELISKAVVPTEGDSALRPSCLRHPPPLSGQWEDPERVVTDKDSDRGHQNQLNENGVWRR